MAAMNDDPKIAVRQRTFLKAMVYYDNRRASIECIVRDLSDSGARLAFEHPVTIPDHIELFIPQKQQTLRAYVRRREPNEVGVTFEIERALEPRRTSDAELQQRVETLEADIKALKRLVAKLTPKVLPHDTDAA
jgi:hypothetical protein